MTKINSYEQFAELQKRYPRTISNDLLMPAEVRTLIEYGKLQYVATDDGLFMFIEREGFWKLVFRIKTVDAGLVGDDSQNHPVASCHPSKEGNRTLATYLVYRERKSPIECEEWLQSQGFERLMRLERYVLKSRNISQDHTHTNKRYLAPNEGNKITIAEGSDITTSGVDEVYTFLNQYFSFEEMDLPARDMYDENNSFCERSDSGELQGVVYDMGYTRIAAVSPDARGSGIGRKLYHAYMESAMQGGTQTFCEWIRPDNHASIAMFKKLGFEKDTLVSNCWVKKTI